MKKLLLIFQIIIFTLTSNVVWSAEYKNNPGFKDLKPGMPQKEVRKFCRKLVKTSFDTEEFGGKETTFSNNYVKCYGIDNIKFLAKGDGITTTLAILNLDMGPIVASDGSFFSQLNNLVVSNDDEPNIYLKMKRNFDAKYVLDYEYSERDRQLFNENEKDELLGVYSNGQVVLRINRKERENSYSKDLWLYIEYRDVGVAKEFLEKNRPVTASLDDF